MYKQILIVLLIIIMALTLNTCSKYNKIKAGDEEDILFNDTVYCYQDYGFWNCEPKKLTEIGWIWWYIPLITKTQFYSDSIDSPDFIYCGRTRDVWLKDGYDYTIQKFYIDDTDYSFEFSKTHKDIELDKNTDMGESIAQFTWHIDGHKELKNSPFIYFKDDVYYIQYVWNESFYQINDDFLNLLKEAKVLL